MAQTLSLCSKVLPKFIIHGLTQCTTWNADEIDTHYSSTYKQIYFKNRELKFHTNITE
jgi:hypothetical protein